MAATHKNIFAIIFIILSIILYFYGFYTNENSAGAGGYNGDLKHVLNNIQIFINQNSFDAIIDENYYSNRGPIIYLLYKNIYNFLNFTIYNHRLIVFSISSLIPIFFFLSLKIKYEKANICLIGLLTSIILFSPYLRTSAYWGLEENYAILSALISSIFFNLVKNKKKNKILNLTLLTFFSSLCVYLDYKYIIIPLISFFSILLTEKSIKIKLFITILYFILAMPLFWILYLWGGIFPKRVIEGHNLEIFLNHLPYFLTIIGLYLFPFLWIKKKKFFQLCLKNLNKNFIIYFIIVFLFLFYIIFFFEAKIQDFHQNIGKGFFDKINNFLFLNNALLKNIFLLVGSIISFIIVCLTFENNKRNWLIFLYFLILSILIYPLLQEYFDPIIFIILLTFTSINLNLNLKNLLFLYSYYFFLFIFAYFYYDYKLNL